MLGSCGNWLRLAFAPHVSIVLGEFSLSAIAVSKTGELTFTGLRLKTKGTQTITVTDTLTGALTDTLSVSVS